MTRPQLHATEVGIVQDLRSPRPMLDLSSETNQVGIQRASDYYPEWPWLRLLHSRSLEIAWPFCPSCCCLATSEFWSLLSMVSPLAEVTAQTGRCRLSSVWSYQVVLEQMQCRSQPAFQQWGQGAE